MGAYSGRGQAQHQAAEACVPTLVRNIKRFSHLIGHKIKSELIKTLEWQRKATSAAAASTQTATTKTTNNQSSHNISFDKAPAFPPPPSYVESFLVLGFSSWRIDVHVVVVVVAIDPISMNNFGPVSIRQCRKPSGTPTSQSHWWPTNCSSSQTWTRTRCWPKFMEFNFRFFQAELSVNKLRGRGQRTIYALQFNVPSIILVIALIMHWIQVVAIFKSSSVGFSAGNKQSGRAASSHWLRSSTEQLLELLIIKWGLSNQVL